MDSSVWQYVVMWKVSRGRKWTAGGQVWRADGRAGWFDGWRTASAVNADMARLCSWWNRDCGRRNARRSPEDELEVASELLEEKKRDDLKTFFLCFSGTGTLLELNFWILMFSKNSFFEFKYSFFYCMVYELKNVNILDADKHCYTFMISPLKNV